MNVKLVNKYNIIYNKLLFIDIIQYEINLLLSSIFLLIMFNISSDFRRNKIRTSCVLLNVL